MSQIMVLSLCISPALKAAVLFLSALAAVAVSSIECPLSVDAPEVQRIGEFSGWCARAQVDFVVAYVHGYYDSVESAARDHTLVSQFRSSGVAAFFVMLQAPSSAREGVTWTSAGQLHKALAAVLGDEVPPLLLVGHSGAYRTMEKVLSPKVRAVVLLDGFYSSGTEWSRWLNGDSTRTLTLVSQHTKARAWRWVTSLPRARSTQVKHFDAGCSHMDIVRTPRWIARTLREASSMQPVL